MKNLQIGQRLEVLRIEDEHAYGNAFIIRSFRVAKKSEGFYSGYDVIDETGLSLYLANSTGSNMYTKVGCLVIKTIKNGK